MTLFNDAFRGRKILLTGHTGFKGSWLSLWLTQLGAEVTGISLPPDSSPSHWDLLQLPMASHLADINDLEYVKNLVKEAQPELVIHLAAQPLVRASYLEPLLTWQTNVMGTANLLEACRQQVSIKSILVVTTDKVYENNGVHQQFIESDPLGGNDPYSASKAAAELLVQTYRRSFFADRGVLLASARAGNVVGGGDWAQDRLIPDIIRAMHANSPLEIRYPAAIRPWQHVLDSLAGYLCLAHGLLKQETDKAKAWNFGPDPHQSKTVAEVLAEMKLHWPELQWLTDTMPQLHEAERLTLDSSAACANLGWKPVWGFAQTAQYTAEWYKRFYLNQQLISQQQLEAYIRDAQMSGVAWASN
jgi:CDP-glucose 4,6-dehydratase